MTEDMSHDGETFLIKLLDETGGDTGVKCSMFDIGEALDMDRETSDRITTELMGWQYVEIKTLSGGIGITREGIEFARKMGGNLSGAESGPTLGHEPVADASSKEACESMLDYLKTNSKELSLDLDGMEEFVADMNTIKSQLASPKPKTAVLKETFLSLEGLLKQNGATDKASEIRRFLDL